ncbi:phenylpyruvate tautomerase MIF-related protein [Candidatus Endoriftia persephonae]|jgi:phenylpyruvate tautomerase PptA (4-oxalocrotonate tautomerase family)|uniref:L-dopachrome isomerase n=2 Tax=Gammaproteobacteria TaxID=1236 RepID=G2FDN9_9GAMM|nr:phenylpyruvate tautomerase MIF-related protein [Candidatus Endoriftia persephone]EGW55094.1 putative phenylpyruvate tautomerase [endosymbiont of Tevnia jerichonana (vent Tica)]USF88300.1 phenylpyruvate tautomerase MIF-related protein [Candidatus Endoriftia persephone]
MPLLKIQTNQPIEPDQRKSLLRKASAEVAALLGKPERFVMVSLEQNPEMLFAGSDAPLAYLELKSIGLPGERTQELSDALCHLIADRLGISAERIYIEFADAQRHLWGWNGATFER